MTDTKKDEARKEAGEIRKENKAFDDMCEKFKHALVKEEKPKEEKKDKSNLFS